MESPASFELTPRQAAIAEQLAGDALHCLIYGGSRSGKTFLFCYAVACRALAAPDSRHLIARLHNIDARQAVMMDTWPKMMRLAFPGLRFVTNRSDQFVKLPNGSEIWFGGLDDDDRVDKILGKEFATVYVNECSQVSFDAVQTLRTRLAQVCKRIDGSVLRLKAYYDLNPVGRGHWSFREFVELVRPENGLALNPSDYMCAVMNPTDNPHLELQYLGILANLPERQRQRFYEGKYLSEVPGALWTADLLESLRVDKAPALARTVVGVDPSGSDGTGGDLQGIVTVGIGVDGFGYVLADDSCRLPPLGWARRTVEAYSKWKADKIVAETNFGGAMVESTIRSVDAHVPLKLVTASRAKHVRAEPVAALFEQRKVFLVGRFPQLEEQLCMTTTAGYQGSSSPDRLDALVWAITELMLAEQTTGILDYYRAEYAKKQARV